MSDTLDGLMADPGTREFRDAVHEVARIAEHFLDAARTLAGDGYGDDDE